MVCASVVKQLKKRSLGGCACAALLGFVFFGTHMARAHAAKSKTAEQALTDVYLPNAKLLELGKKVFIENCSGCHGEAGDGKGMAAEAFPIKPRNFLTDKFKWGNTPSKIVETIDLGRSGIMPPFKDYMPKDQKWAAAHYVWSLMPAANRASDTSNTLKALKASK